MKNSGLKGNALFYCSFDARRDKKIRFQAGPETVREIDSRQFAPGYYIVKLSWTTSYGNYYSEQPFLIQ